MYDLVYAEKRMKRDSGMRSVVQRLIKSTSKIAAAAAAAGPRKLIPIPSQIDDVASISRSQQLDGQSHKIKPDSRPENGHVKANAGDVSGTRGFTAGSDKHVSGLDKDRQTGQSVSEAHQRGRDNQFQFESDKDIALYNDLIAGLVGWDSPDWRYQLLR
jgi:hypothetical protein